jgi:hypothetical protein
MCPKLERTYCPDGSYIDASVQYIKSDRWRPHGVRYRLAWIQNGKARVLFDNHHGKGDHFHVDDEEYPYCFSSVKQLGSDFAEQVKRLGGPE